MEIEPKVNTFFDDWLIETISEEEVIESGVENWINMQDQLFAEWMGWTR